MKSDSTKKTDGRRGPSRGKDFIKTHFSKRPWNSIVIIAALALVFVTVYTLILPALSMSRPTYCGMEEHVHTEACYSPIETHMELDCPFKPWTQVILDDGTITGQGFDGVVIHTHDENCYQDGVLICPLPEVQTHVHTDECYQDIVVGTRTVEAPSQGEAAAEFAFEGEGTVDAGQNLNTAAPEFITEDIVERQLVCGREEYNPEPHIHTPECYSADGALVCMLGQVAVHQHDAGCWHEVQTGGELVCGLPEHTHEDGCFEAPEAPVSLPDPAAAEGQTPEELPAGAPAEVTVTEETPAGAPAEVTVTEGTPAESPAEAGVVEEAPAQTPAEAAIIEEAPAQAPAEAAVIEEAPAQAPTQPPAEAAVIEEAPTQAPAEVAIIEEAPIQAPAEAAVIEGSPAEGTSGTSLPEGEASRSGKAKTDTGANPADTGANPAGKGETVPGAVVFEENITATAATEAFAPTATPAAADSKTGSEEEKPASEKTDAIRTARILEFRGDDYTVRIIAGEESGITDGASVTAVEIPHDSEEYAAYIAQAKAALGLDEDKELPAEYARFFDITIRDAEGNEIQPDASIRVEILYDEKIEADNVNAVHFEKDGSVDVLPGVEKAGPKTLADLAADEQTMYIMEDGAFTQDTDPAGSPEGVSFDADAFSVYGVIYTVDFETIDGGIFSIPGGSTYALSDILQMLGYPVRNEDIVSADFTRPSVVNISVEDGVWMLSSTGSFFTNETLTVQLADQTVITIHVTDAAITYDNIEYGNIADLADRIGVRVNGTNLDNQQARDRTFNLTFDYTMLFDNAAAALLYQAGGNYNWCYDLSEMAEQYPEISEFPDMTGTLRNGRIVQGTYEVKDNKVFLHVYPSAVGTNPTRINGTFSLNMKMDANGTGSEDHTTFSFPGGATFTVKYKPVEYKNGTKSANPASAVIYPDQYDNGYYFIDYTARLVEEYDLKSLVFEDILGPMQDLVASSVKVNGHSAAVTKSGDAASGQTFTFNVLDALGTPTLPANTEAVVTYRVRVAKEEIEKAGAIGLRLANDAGWKVNDTTIPGGDTVVTVREEEYTKPDKTIQSSSSRDSGGPVVNPGGEKKEIAPGVYAVKAKTDWQNADGTYHISYGVSFREGAVPVKMSLTDTYGGHQTLLTGSFTVSVNNGQKLSIPESYIRDNGGSFTIPDLKGAIRAATGVDFAADTQYSVNYETSVTSADFDVAITNTASLIMDKTYPDEPTEIILTGEDFQPGTKKNVSGKYVKLANGTDPQTTDWEISITEPKNAGTKAQLTDTFDSRLSVIKDSFRLSVDGTDYEIPESFIVTTGGTNRFTVDLNAVLAYLKSNAAGYTGNAYVTAGVNYTLKYRTATNVSQVFGDIKANNKDAVLKNEADWVFADGGDDSPQEGGEDTVTYTIPPYRPTAKSDTVTGNVARNNGKYRDATYYITGEGPYTIHYTITVPAQERDLTGAVLTDTFTVNQTIDWTSFRVNGTPVTAGLSRPEPYTEGTAWEGETPATKQFTLDLFAAMGLSNGTVLKAGTTVGIEYEAQTDILDEHILNSAAWLFDGDHPDGPHDTDEKIVRPEYQPGTKKVYNKNYGKEVPVQVAAVDESGAPVLDENGRPVYEPAEYSFDWTLTITEPAELSRAVLHDDYGTDSKDHTLVFPVTVTAGGITRTIKDSTDPAIEHWDPQARTFDINMMTLFGKNAANGDRFPANTTFTVKYATKTTGDTILAEGTYHNKAKWDFDGTIGPKEDVPGGEDRTTLKTTEYNDGTKTAWYNGRQRHDGSFYATEGTILDYIATIEQDHAVATLNYIDTWNDSRITLVYPVTVEDNDGRTVASYADAEALKRAGSVSDTGFTLALVTKGKLPDGTDFKTGVTYRVKYGLDFSGLIGPDGEPDGTHVRNNGHWHTEGVLPDHDDDHPTDDEPKYPEWKPVDKAVTDVKYTNREVSPAITEKSLDSKDNVTWWSDDYTQGQGSFFIDYEVSFTEPRELTGLVLTDLTDLPADYSEFCPSPVVLTFLDADGNTATRDQLGGRDAAAAAFRDTEGLALTDSDAGGHAGFTLDVIGFLKQKLGRPDVKIPKDFTVKLSFRVELKNTMDGNGFVRVNRPAAEPWRNTVTARFNNVAEFSDEVKTYIRTRMKMEKDVSLADDASSASINGRNLGKDGRGRRVKYTITVGGEGDTFATDYWITDSLTNVNVQHFDTASGITVNGTKLPDSAFTYAYQYNDRNTIIGFSYAIPAGTQGPVVIEYYVTNASQEEADAKNSDGNRSNDIWGVQTQTNTVTNPEEKEITTTYDVEYTSDHRLEKTFQKWDKAAGTATWKVTATAESTRKFPAGYRIKEEIFRYYSEEHQPDATWSPEDYRTYALGDMTLDLSKVIVVSEGSWGGTAVLKSGTDYRIEDDSIVFLKDIDARIVRVAGIRTTIPGYDPDSTEVYYYYNDASIRSDRDSLLDEDDDQNRTDATALIEKKYAGYELIDDRPYWTWQIIITPPKDGLAGWKWQETVAGEISSKAYGVMHKDADGNIQYSNEVTVADNGGFSMVTEKGVVLDDTYYNRADCRWNPVVFTEKINNIKDRIIITVRTCDMSWNKETLLYDNYTAFNYVTLTDKVGETSTAHAEKDFSNADIMVTKEVADTGGTLTADGRQYKTIERVGDNLYEYTIRMNANHRDIRGEVTLTDLLPSGFELVDWNGEATGKHERSGYYYYDTGLDVYYSGPVYNNGDPKLDAGYETYLQPQTVTDPVTGERHLPIDESTGRYRIIVGNMSAKGYNVGQEMVVKYKVRLTEDEKQRLASLATGAVQYYENVATVTVGSRVGTATETVAYRYDKALNKEDITLPANATIGEITYEVQVNNEPGEAAGTYSPRRLNAGEPLTLSDTLSTSLELNRAGIRVYRDVSNDNTWVEIPFTQDIEAVKAGNGYSVSYDGDARLLSFKLADQTHFRVVIPCWAEDPTEDITGWVDPGDHSKGIVKPFVRDGEIDDADAIANSYYLNTITLVGEGRFEDSVDEKHVVYEAGGSIQAFEGDGFAIDKFDGNNILRNLEGATFQLYEVTEFDSETASWPDSWIIPEMREWKKVGEPQTTDENGIVKWDNLQAAWPDTTYPADFYDAQKQNADTGWTEEESGRVHVVLYAWIETGLSANLKAEGYTVGDNSEPHYVILYYTARSQKEVTEDLYGKNAISGTDYNSLTEDEKRLVDDEVKREQTKALSSYDTAAAFDYNYQNANFITISTSKSGYTWPVPNTNTVNKTVIKLWDDNQNAKGLRPKAEKITVQLYQNGVKYGPAETLKDTTISAADARYSFTWENLPAVDSSGNDYVYTVEETYEDENYTATYSEDTFTITNHLVEDTTVTARKVWDDDNNAERKRPASVTYQLYQMTDGAQMGDSAGEVKQFGPEVTVTDSGQDPVSETVDGAAVTISRPGNFSAKWENLPQVDNPDSPTATYSYFVVESKLTAADGKEYWLDDDTNKFYQHDEDGNKTGDPLYISDISNEGNIYTITNTAISARKGSVKLVKELTGLTGNHGGIDVDGDGAGTVTADKKLYRAVLRDSEGYAVYAEKDEENSTDALSVYNYIRKQATTTDYTVFEISEAKAVQINGLPLGAYAYTASEITSDGEALAIKGYTFDADVSGGSVTTVSVKPVEGEDSPAEARFVNNYIPDKGSIRLTKKVDGLPEGTDLTRYSFPVVITLNGAVPVQYVSTDGTLTSSRIIHYVTPGTVYTVSDVPVGRYDVTELVDDSRMPDLREGAAAGDGTDEGITEDALAQYHLNPDGSTTELKGLNVTKNSIRQGELVNHYTTETVIEVSKVWSGNGTYTPWGSDVRSITLKLTRTKGGADGTPDESFGTDGTLAVTVSKTDGGFAVSGLPEGVNGEVEETRDVGNDHSPRYLIRITGLQKQYRDGSEYRDYRYYFAEVTPEGYNDPAYGILTESEGTVSVNDTPGAANTAAGGVIINTSPDAVELPSTGGPGTGGTYAAGIALIAFAAFGLLMLLKRRPEA